MSSPVELFGLATRGVNIVEAPTHLSVEEVTSAQNVEVVSDAGENALDQRPGMSKVNAAALNGSVVMAQDVPADVLLTKTPTLYMGMQSPATHNWRKTTDGTTWTNDDTPAKAWSDLANAVGAYFKSFSRCATIKGKLYFPGGTTPPINIHQFDGTTDKTVTTVPPAVSGVSLLGPGVYPTDAAGLTAGFNGTVGATTYSYKFVSVAGATHSGATAAASLTNGFATLSSSNYVAIQSLSAPPPTGALSIDVYRTAGGATQGKIGTIPIVAGAYSMGNGSGIGGLTYVFTDAGLTGDATTAPVSASGSAAAGDALAVLDMTTDGTSLYLAVEDLAGADPVVYGRVLKYTPASNAWTQVGANFPMASGNGCPGALAFYGGTLSFATFAGATAGNTTYVNNAGSPLPAGGVQEVHATAASQLATSIAVFNGDLYVGYTHLAATAATLVKRVAGATWSTSLTAPGSTAQNGWTAMCVFNGKLFAGWNPAGAGAKIYSTPDGVTWTLELTTALNAVPTGMVVFNNALYVTIIGFAADATVYQRNTAGTWTLVDQTTDQHNGAIGVVYV